MKPVTWHDCKRRILHVLVHIQERLDEPLGLDELAEVACFSRFHFHRILRGMVGDPEVSKSGPGQIRPLA